MQDRVAHFFGSPHGDEPRSHRRCQGGGCADQNNLRAGIQCGLRHCVALLAGGSIGQHTYRIDRFLGSAGRNYDPATGELAGPTQDQPDVPEELIRFKHAASAGKSGSQVSFSWAADGSASVRQLGEVLLGRRMIQHAAVHGRSHEQWARGRQGSDGEDVIGLPGGQLGDGVGGAWGNDKHVRAAAQANVQDVSFAAPQVGLGVGVAARDGLQSQGSDEFFGGWREDDVHQRAHLSEL